VSWLYDEPRSTGSAGRIAPGFTAGHGL